MTGPSGSSAGSKPIPPGASRGKALAPSEQKNWLKTCHLSTSHQPQCHRAGHLHVACSEPIKARPISLQTRHPRVLPPCSLCGWGLTTALRVGWSSCARSSSDVLRLLSPHEGWKLPLFSLCSPVPNQYGSPGWTTEGLEATWRGDVEDEMPAWTWRTATKRDHPAEFQPTHRIMRSNVAGTEISISRLTFQGKEKTQQSWPKLSMWCEEPPTYFIIFIFIIIRFKNTIQ